MCTFDPKHIIISHQGQQPRYNIIIIGLNDEFETTNYFNYAKKFRVIFGNMYYHDLLAGRF